MAKKRGYVEVTVKQKPIPLIERIELAPWPVEMAYRDRYFAFPASIHLASADARTPDVERAFRSLRVFIESLHGVRLGELSNNWPVRLTQTVDVSGKEAYQLSLSEKGAEIKASHPAGLFYGAQTLIQVLACSFHVRLMLGSQTPAEPEAIARKWVPVLEISDSPAYTLRSFMVDMGRANFSMPLLKRIIRIISHLKLNLLHLHLFDDQMGGLRFDHLPLGSENPAAITIAQLSDLVAYARDHHVSIMPEIESWGHVQSVLYHYPELYGGPGMWGGMSFGIGEKTYALLEKIYDEVLGAMEAECMLHVGLDEAVWAVLPGEERKGHSPVNMVGRIYDLVQTVGRKQGRQVTMHLWADHGGRPLPREIARKVVIEPWKYRQTDETAIVHTLKKYGGCGKTPCMMGAGWSSIHYAGSCDATRIWTREGLRYPNILGVTNCMWENNDLSGQMIGLYGGAAYSWNPHRPTNTERDPHFEDVRCFIHRQMRRWQAYFPDADSGAIERDRGPEIAHGRYVFGPMAGWPASPTVEWKRSSG